MWELVPVLIYSALIIYCFALTIFSIRLVFAVERIAQNVEIGVAAWTKNLRQQPGGSAQQLPPT